jgi:hypothetical protein
LHPLEALANNEVREKRRNKRLAVTDDRGESR